MKLKGISFVAKISAIGILLVLLLTLAVSCQATEAPATVSEGPATSELNVDLLGTQHTYFLHGEGRLAGSAVLESPDHTVSLSIDKGTTLLDKDGKPLPFLQVRTDSSPPNPPADAQIIGTVYDLTPHEATSNPPLMLTLPYRPEDLPEDVQAKDLYIAPYDEENGWGKSFYRKIDTENHMVTAQVSTFCKYAVLAPKELPPPPSLTMTPLEEALSSGKPTLAEFGWRTCIPCKQMKPILKELAVEYEGTLNVVIVEVYEQKELTQKHGIMAIPTQIFFDSSGKEIIRHIGLWPKEQIIAQLKKMGVD
jgi:thioredoxin 1